MTTSQPVALVTGASSGVDPLRSNPRFKRLTEGTS